MTPPNNKEIERLVLGAMLVDEESLILCMDYLTDTSFYNPFHKLMFITIKTLFDSGKPVDFMILTDELKLEDTHKIMYISETAGQVGATANIRNHCDILIDLSLQRAALVLSQEILKSIESQAVKGTDLLVNIDSQIAKLLEGKRRDYQKIGSELMDVLDWIQKIGDSNNRLIGINTGYNKLNYLTGGFQGGDLITLAAPTGHGKTSLGLEFAFTASREQIPVGIFSMEMTVKQLGIRALQNISRTDLNVIYQRKLNSNEWEAIQEACTLIHKMNIHISDEGGINISEIKSRTKRMIRESGIKLLIVDYIQLINTKASGIEESIRNITTELKSLAMNENIPVIGISQYHRQAGEKFRRPMLRDLKGSAAIEQNSDIVLMLHNHFDRGNEIKSSDKIEEKTKKIYSENIAGYDDMEETMKQTIRELIIRKNRRGNEGVVFLMFQKEFTRFRDISVIQD